MLKKKTENRKRALCRKCLTHRLAALDLAGEGAVGHELVVELDAEQVRGGLGGLEVDPELGVALALHVVGHVLAAHADDDLQVAGAGVRGVDREVDGLAHVAAADVGDHDLGLDIGLWFDALFKSIQLST